MSHRRLWVLIQYLPMGSWTQTALRDATEGEPLPAPTDQKFGPWDREHYLLAALTDAINANTYVTAVAGHLKDPAKPEPIPRPGMNRRQRRQSDAAVLYLESRRAPKG